MMKRLLMGGAVLAVLLVGIGAYCAYINCCAPLCCAPPPPIDTEKASR